MHIPDDLPMEYLTEIKKLVIRAQQTCHCRTCADQTNKAITEATGEYQWMVPMIVCSNCGNKRCPHANHHDNPCTGSNELGQEGSAY